MLHIILVILKLIGLALLVLLGLVITLLLVLLLVPVRYRVQVAHGETFRLNGRVSWLFHIIHVRITQEGELRRFLIRIFGFVFYDSARPAKPKQRRRGRRRAASREEEPEPGEEPASEIPIQYAEDISESGSDKAAAPGEGTETDKLRGPDRTISAETDTDQVEADNGGENRKISLPGRIIGRVKRFFLGIRDKIKRIGQSIRKGLAKLKSIRYKIGLVKEFIKDEENREAFRLTYGSLKKLLKHILPTKLKSQLIFGTGDPCSTGQALGAFSILYSFYGDRIRITPDFENKIFEGTHYARGRIRIGTLLIIVTKLILDKKFKPLKRNFKILKEAL